MARRGSRARRACAAALTAAGGIALACLVGGMLALASLRTAATAVERDPPASDRAAEAGEALAQDAGQDATSSGSVDWAHWKAVNDRVVGWICIPGTSIDLPVVQAPADDPRFYLTHDVFGNWNPYGCLYVDAACTEGLDSAHVVIYGHNMGDGSMLGEIVRYRDRNWARTRRRVELLTPQGARTLEVEGADTISGTEAAKRLDFGDAGELARYAQEKARSCQVPLGDADGDAVRLYTLCTCSYLFTPADERTLVYAVEQFGA